MDAMNKSEYRKRKYFTCVQCRVKQPIEDVCQWQRFKALCVSCYNDGYYLLLCTDLPVPPRRWWVVVARGRPYVSQSGGR